MNCKNIQSRLSAYVDRELDKSEMLEIRTHLHSCEDCQAEEFGYRTLKQFLEGAAPVEPPAGFEDRLIQNVLGGSCRDAAAPSRKPAYMFAAVAAAAAMIATLLILPATRTPVRMHNEAATTSSNDYALEINRDQLYEASSDPLSGGHLASPAVYGR